MLSQFLFTFVLTQPALFKSQIMFLQAIGTITVAGFGKLKMFSVGRLEVETMTVFVIH